MSRYHRSFAAAALVALTSTTFLTSTLAEPPQKEKLRQDSPAVAVARAHVEAWSNHNYEKVRKLLADDVHVITTTTQPIMKEDVNTHGIEEYMRGLKEFAETVEKGSARVVWSSGGEHDALLVVTAKA